MALEQLPLANHFLAMAIALAALSLIFSFEWYIGLYEIDNKEGEEEDEEEEEDDTDTANDDEDDWELL